MTKEEALYKVNGYLTDIIPAEDYLEVEEIIKALKSEPIIDKIRAEIEELDGKYVIGDYGIYGENCPKYVRLWDVLQIIDKSNAESEVLEWSRTIERRL